MSSTPRLSRRRGERPVLYGRDRERARLREVLATTAAGHGSLVLVSGEAGIGKTTLVDDLIHEVRQQGCLVLTGGCYDLTTTPPYGPWSEAIRGYHPEDHLPAVPSWFGNPDAMAQVGNQTTLFDETRRFFAAVAEHQPLVIVLEDLHWSDSASLEALRYLARTLGDNPVLLVATYREDEITRRHDLYQLLPILVRESKAQRIHLSPLARHDVWEMVTGRYNLATAEIERLVMHLNTRSEGNPFFAEEILQGLEDVRVLQPVAGGWKLGNLDATQIPVPLRQALELRLARLSTETRAALQVAAVIGQHVPLDLWRELTDVETADFEWVVTEPLEAHVLEETAKGDTLEFRHALLREALYASITLNKRRELHQRVGEALAAKPNTEPDAVAHHFEISGDARAPHWWVRAGVRAQGSYALRVAADCYATALDLLEADPESAQIRGWLFLHLGYLMRKLVPKVGTAYVDEAVSVARLVNDPLLAAQSEYIHGLLRCYQDDIGAGLKEMESASASWELVTASQKQHARQAIESLFPAELLSNVRVADESPLFRVVSTPDINSVMTIYIIFLATTGRFREAIRVGVPFVEHVTAAIDETQIVQDVCAVAYQGLAVAADWLGQPETARAWRAKALEACRDIGNLVQTRHVHFHELTYILIYQTDLVEIRRRVVAELLATAELPGGTLFKHPLETLKLNVDLLEGSWGRARDVVNESFGAHDHFARFIRTRAYRILGREQDDERFASAVWADIYAALPDGPATEPGQADHEFGIVALQSAADLTLDTGELAGARDWIAAHDRWVEWSESVLGRAEAQLLWARYHRIAGDLERARRHAEQALGHASDPRQPLALIAAYRALGQIETETGHYDGAHEHLRASLDLAERCDAPYEQALTMLQLAELAALIDDTAKAQQLLHDVRAICEPLEAKCSLERADRIAAQLNEMSGEHPAGLSSREVEVLEQAATGMTNAEIGEALFISPRTVAQHLRSVYNKLGVNNRAGAVARWIDIDSH